MSGNIYTIEWTPKAIRAFKKIKDPKMKGYILDVLENFLIQNPFAGKLLSGSLKEFRSYRMGVIRILYKVYKDRLVLVVLTIAHRRDVYRR